MNIRPLCSTHITDKKYYSNLDTYNNSKFKNKLMSSHHFSSSYYFLAMVPEMSGFKFHITKLAKTDIGLFQDMQCIKNYGENNWENNFFNEMKCFCSVLVFNSKVKVKVFYSRHVSGNQLLHYSLHHWVPQSITDQGYYFWIELWETDDIQRPNTGHLQYTSKGALLPMIKKYFNNLIYN